MGQRLLSNLYLIYVYPLRGMPDFAILTDEAKANTDFCEKSIWVYWFLINKL